MICYHTVSPLHATPRRAEWSVSKILGSQVDQRSEVEKCCVKFSLHKHETVRFGWGIFVYKHETVCFGGGILVPKIWSSRTVRAKRDTLRLSFEFYFDVRR